MKNKHDSLETVVLIVLVLVLTSICTCIFLSCGNIFQNPPFILSSPECVLTSDTASFRFAGVKFSVWNARQSVIKRISAVFSVYKDEHGGNPFSGGNVVSATLECSIAPGECEEFEAGLDPYISETPKSPYYIDFFYLKEVLYEDGEVWSDPAGAFYVRGKK